MMEVKMVDEQSQKHRGQKGGLKASEGDKETASQVETKRGLGARELVVVDGGSEGHFNAL